MPRQRNSLLTVLLALWALALIAQSVVAEGRIRFREMSRPWGIDFRHHHGGSGERYMPETMVGGVVIFDYDADGDVDLFFVDGGAMPGYQGEPTRSRLLRNDSGGPDGPRFVDVTAGSGIQVTGYGCGAVAGDVDNDGDLDLYVTAFGENQLFRNNGDGSFTDVTARAGVGDPRWSGGASLADVDRDGDLDLYVANYVDFTIESHKRCGEEKGMHGYCIPSAYNNLGDRFYRNRGDGTFEDRTREAGFAAAVGAGLGVVFGDLNNDSWPDLYVANDMTPNFLFLNQGDGTFEDLSLLSGTAYGDRGPAEAGMGVDLADLDGNGLFDIVVTNFELETNSLYQNEGEGIFADVRYAIGLAQPSLHKLTFGVAFADFDHDGDQDLVVANGHINDNAEALDSVTPYRQGNQLFENVGGRFRELKNTHLDVVRASRGLAVGDLDVDGDLDVVVVNSNDLAEVYQNLTGDLSGHDRSGGWLAVDLAGASGNLLGVGARLELSGSGAVQYREARTGSSYLSQNALTVHFGAVEPERLVVRWPSGKVREIRRLPVRRRLWIVE